MFSILRLAWGRMKVIWIQGGPALPKCQVTNSPRRMATGKRGWRLNYSDLSSHANWVPSQPQEIFRGRNSLYFFPFILSQVFGILFYILLSVLKGILWRKDQFLGLTRLRVLQVLGRKGPIFSPDWEENSCVFCLHGKALDTGVHQINFLVLILFLNISLQEDTCFSEPLQRITVHSLWQGTSWSTPALGWKPGD